MGYETAVEIVPTCPCCGGTTFGAIKSRPLGRCLTCRAVERTRVAKLFLDRYVKPSVGMRVLHIAPEIGLARGLMAACGDNYEPADIEADRYARNLGRPVKQIDLSSQGTLPKERYDLVMHHHVLEHVPANWTLVLQELHASVAPGGVHLFSVPFNNRGYLREDLDPSMNAEERTERFGQHQHMRVFGQMDFDLTLAPVLGLSPTYSLLDWFAREDLAAAAVPPGRWGRVNGATVFYVRKPA